MPPLFYPRKRPQGEALALVRVRRCPLVIWRRVLRPPLPLLDFPLRSLQNEAPLTSLRPKSAAGQSNLSRKKGTESYTNFSIRPNEPCAAVRADAPAQVHPASLPSCVRIPRCPMPSLGEHA